MPIPLQDLIAQPDTSRIQVRLEPVHNALHSLLLISETDQYAGLDEWVARTYQAMSVEERQRHKLVMNGLHYAIQPSESLPSFPAYLEHLSKLEPLALRDKMLEAYVQHTTRTTKEEVKPWHRWTESEQQTILSSVENYLAFLNEHFEPSCLDVEMEARAYSYVIDPLTMKDLIVSHLRGMWDRYLRDEWVRVRPMLEDSVTAFRHLNFSTMSNLEVARLITGQEQIESKWAEHIGAAQQVVFVPNAHVGPYLGKFRQGQTLGIIFGARLPKGLSIESPDLSRAEILVHLNALADETRLRLLYWIAEHGEQRSQEIMRGLGLSQSTTSRHLSQLTAAGLLSERWVEGGKCYTINSNRFREALEAIAAYVRLDGFSSAGPD